MFDGSFKSRRNISLGGNKQQVDKQKLLRQAQEERRVREAERVRLKAAERIQARQIKASEQLYYLARDPSAATRSVLFIFSHISRPIYLVLVSRKDSSNQGATGGAHGLGSGYPHITAPTSFAIVINIYGINVNSNINPTAFSGRYLCRGVGGSSQQSEWNVALMRLLPILLKHLGQYAPWIEEDSASALTILDILTLADATQPAQGSAGTYAKGFSEVLSKSGAFASLAQFLSRISLDEKSRSSVAKALLLSIRLCKVGEQSEEFSTILDQFVTHILAVPLLPNRMSIETLTTFTSRLPLDAILLHLSTTSCAAVASLPQYRITPLVANVLAFGHRRVTKMLPAVSNAYLQVLTTLFGMIPQDSVEPVSKRYNGGDDDENLEEMEWQSEGILGSSTAPAQSSTASLDPKIMKWLSLAYDSNHLNDILGSVEPVASASGDGAQEVLSTESIGEITQLLLNLITLFPSHKINILSNLMYFRFGGKSKGASLSPLSASGGKFFGISIIKIFLDAFMSTVLYQQLVQSMQQDSPLSVQVVLDPAHSKAWSLLAFVSELYCQILVTMGDDEFHDEARNPISLPSVITLSSAVRDVAFLLWWNDNALDMEASLGRSQNLRIGYLRDITTKLTRQLHARDSRKAFCPKDHWLLSMPLDMSAFKRAVIQDEESLSRDQEDEDMDGEDSVVTGLDSSQRQRAINRRRRGLKGSQLARLSPRLGVLNNIPFVIRFEDRVAIFREFVEADRGRAPDRSSLFHPHAVGQARVRRGFVFEDGFDQLNSLGPQLKGRIAISFIDQYGIPEAGIDGGGVFKEFLTSLVLQAFDTNYGLFMSTSDQLLYPNPHRFAQERTQLQHYEFLGRILGKALYEGILIDAAFAGFFLAKCLGQVNYLDDLPSLDPELYRGLMFLKNYDGNVEDLSLYFTVDDEEMGQTITRELISNGSNILVTRQNRIRYIYLTAHYRLNTQIDRQCRAFFHGLSDLIDPKWLWMFNQQELQVMLGGAQTPISLTDLAQNVVYSNFERTDPTIEYFWEVVQEMSEEDRRLLIKFVTSCARPPLLGFKELNPKLCIRNAGQEEDRLPTSSTCMNLLKLPAFSSRERLKQKLLYAIHSEAGFDLS
ncbi:hypothetical protein EDD11_000101 [Mortierella claussenii]|nr:hypothetical protein EDD11_000101 [Mortierella claussenii]